MGAAGAWTGVGEFLPKSELNEPTRK